MHATFTEHPGGWWACRWADMSQRRVAATFEVGTGFVRLAHGIQMVKTCINSSVWQRKGVQPRVFCIRWERFGSLILTHGD